MTKSFSRQSARVALLALVAVALLVLASHVTLFEPRRISTQIQWFGFAHWKVGWKRLAFCSEQNAGFRGWTASLGPFVVTRIRPVFAIPRIVQPDAPANTSQPFGAETNQTPEAAGFR